MENVFMEIGKTISEYLNLDWDEDKKKNLGIIISNFMDFADYFKIIELFNKNDKEGIVSYISSILKKIPEKKIEEQIKNFVGEEKYDIYYDVVEKLRT